MRTDYHVHTERGPYTVEWLEQFLATARERGVTELGISEHGYRFLQTQALFDNEWTAKKRTEDLDEYMKMVMGAREAGHDVKFGIELDYIPGRNEQMRAFLASYPFDYVIGSVHWLGDFGFDLLEYRPIWDARDIKEVYEEYFSILMQLAESKLFQIIGHPDVIKVFGHEPDDAAFLQDWYNRLADHFKLHDQCIEVSTAGLRKPVQKMYPAPDFLKACFEKGVPIALSSDAHRPEDVGADYEAAIAYIRAAGYEQICTFRNRERTLVPLK
ncbi:histidinol-phosphatase (PHP family) [Tumebacillus sp. BK434]|uniref:histidinol-phosphatase HisJ family protein n=1 Tax=Tumebacillus sp. BK434 TaxID=2512169 RepID=UPI0010532476|nr:histidinol-phosphatase HisJ family protein [Tumebacillus sp. BK434]TCP59503.1 histidinol-phosphatase (PHP family) [Tumebacillus sp. BK434]